VPTYLASRCARTRWEAESATKIEAFFHRSPGLRLAAAATLLTQVSLTATSARSDDFYHGKTVTLLVGYATGGGSDINALPLLTTSGAKLLRLAELRRDH
jgi:hypothetical protein